MNSPLTAYIALISASGVLNVYLCLYVYFKRQRYRNIACYFMIYTATIAIYCFASAFSLMSVTLEQIKFWTTIQYIGMPISAILGLLFIMHYLGLHLSKIKIVALLVVPIITSIMVATNDFHHLYYRVFEIDPVLGAPYINQEIGLWYMIHGAYIFFCMLVALLLAISHWKEIAKIYRPQLLSLILGQFIPMVTAFLYLMELTPRGVDPVPMILWLSSILYLWSISSSRMFTLMPVAKNLIFNSINDGVMVLDESLQLIEFNQICGKYFPKLNKTLIGKYFYDIWLELIGKTFPLVLELESHNQEIQLVVKETKRIYQIRVSPLIEVGNNKGLIIIFTDITELRELQIKLEYQASYDGLTQIYNRRAFMEHCEQNFLEAEQKEIPFTVILMDIDHFKKVNDTYGHYIRDQLLKHVVNIFKSQLTKGQIFARYGGEEFALSLNGYTAVEAELLGNRLRESLEGQSLYSSKGIISVTFSMGVAQAVPDKIETIDQLLNKADKALYSAKQAGRNQVHVYKRVK
ncbi:diguanylate cyclase (GGDEF) domain-containing protein [Carnobacterium iners]|uniref:Diguanylate cyclase (GGDEF) domain-containing protein n=1 Tax=Carnobacterium iners TaxID=1073423 RepID=A0A1X7MR80_9LACT|nr:histidine kinase N-terminal 7TM domain-containing protein [Carnobacterium iners]SEL14434.1 diguanylate cyclase (GGDEF) domain-containing protein [Carnobacterium iners]SMH27349.1 diguanylate cyclase (GGDEF) domain-containing protein [Carnobacterium iners]